MVYSIISELSETTASVKATSKITLDHVNEIETSESNVALNEKEVLVTPTPLSRSTSIQMDTIHDKDEIFGELISNISASKKGSQDAENDEKVKKHNKLFPFLILKKLFNYLSFKR